MTVTREVLESPLRQGVDEVIAYALTTTPWGTAPSAIGVVVKDMSASGADVTATVMPLASSSAAVGDVITLAPLKLLTAGHRYRVEVKFTVSGNVEEPFFLVDGEM